MFSENDKFYFGKEIFQRFEKESMSLGVLGLLEKYCTLMAYNVLKYPWITLRDIQKWCNDDLKIIEYYIKEGIEKDCLILLNDEQSHRLLQNPMDNCWLYE